MSNECACAACCEATTKRDTEKCEWDPNQGEQTTREKRRWEGGPCATCARVRACHLCATNAHPPRHRTLRRARMCGVKTTTSTSRHVRDMRGVRPSRLGLIKRLGLTKWAQEAIKVVLQGRWRAGAAWHGTPPSQGPPCPRQKCYMRGERQGSARQPCGSGVTPTMNAFTKPHALTRRRKGTLHYREVARGDDGEHPTLTREGWARASEAG